VLEAWVGIPTRALGDVRVGSGYEIEVDGDILKAEIASVLPELDPATRTVTVVARITTEKKSKLVPGQTVRLLVPEGRDLRGTWLPTTALMRGVRGLWSCLVVIPQPENESEQAGGEPGLIVERRDVEILHTEEARVLVRGTLREGERVIITGMQRIVPGQRVRISSGESADSI